LTAHIERNDSTAQLFIARTARITRSEELSNHCQEIFEDSACIRWFAGSLWRRKRDDPDQRVAE